MLGPRPGKWDLEVSWAPVLTEKDLGVVGGFCIPWPNDKAGHMALPSPGYWSSCLPYLSAFFFPGHLPSRLSHSPEKNPLCCGSFSS